MSKAKFHVKRGDTVRVISGNHRGSSGKILQVLPEKAKVIIEGVRPIKNISAKPRIIRMAPSSNARVRYTFPT
jgi:large subunit ribosomal protein L24